MAHMGAITDLWKSERGLILVALIASVTVLTGLHMITVDQWLEYTKWLFVTYVAGKTVTGSVGLATKGSPSPTLADVMKLIAPLFAQNSRPSASDSAGSDGPTSATASPPPTPPTPATPSPTPPPTKA